jgi:excisionase family DNA binding protein
VDGSRDKGVGTVSEMTVEEAARNLGIKEESVRKRVRRGKMRSKKGADGRLYVYVDQAETVREGPIDGFGDMYTDRSADEPADAIRGVIESKDETIRILHAQLQGERAARRRADTIIAQLAQANAALATRAPELRFRSQSPRTDKGPRGRRR